MEASMQVGVSPLAYGLDVWLIQVINEWQMQFVTSAWDAVSKLFIAFNISRALRMIPRLVRLRNPPTSASSTCTKPSLVRKRQRTRGVSAMPSAPLSSDLIVKHTHNATETMKCSRGRIWRRRVEHVGHIILAVWGLAGLTAHTQSAMTGNNQQCLVQARPRFTTRPVCSLMEINCYGSQLHGNAKDFDQAIATIQREWLAYLIVRHCAAVEITAQIHSLPSLIGVKVCNSTLIRWDQDAALTQTHNPRMLFVFMAVIKAQAVPPGLYARDFPPTSYDIELSDWNVTSLRMKLWTCGR